MAADFNADGMLDMYLFENSQLLEKLQDIVLEQKDAEGFDENAINEIFRAMHTIKGSSGIMMFDEVTAVSHKLEDVFYYLRESKPAHVPHIQLVEHVLEVADFIQGEMDKLSDGEAADGDATEIIKSLDEFLASIKGESEKEKEKIIEGNVYEEPTQFYIAPMAASNSHFFQIYIVYKEGTQMANVYAYKAVHSIREIAEDILYFPEDIITDENASNEIMEHGFKILLQTNKTEEEVRALIDDSYEVKSIEIFEVSETQYQLGFDVFGADVTIDLDMSVEEIEERERLKEEGVQKPSGPAEIKPGDFVIQSNEPGRGKILAKDKPKKAEKTSFISVDVAKMDMLMDLIGELVISESVVLQNPDLKVPGLKLDNFNKAAGQMCKISTDLQNVIMSMRMLPLTSTFQKMNRIVFDVSRKLGKEIEFEMIGDDTEVDKSIIEHISDPLMHLVRNSVDHGIESPEAREAVGKDRKGKITLFAKTEAGKVWIGVQDNGAGLDRKKIIEKARKQELLDPARKDSSYSDKEVYQFITLPGFSTNETVTEYSGRGVGMDVVVQNIQEIGGSLEIESTPGEGSLMLLKIPLTLAIIDGIVMRAGGAYFVIQTNVVKEFVSVSEDMMVEQPNGEECVMIRGEAYPVRRLGEWYHIADYKSDINKGMMIILNIEDKMVCLFVDELVGKQEIVVKPIPSYVRKVRGLSGCTQLGDGGIALILDPAGLVEQ